MILGSLGGILGADGKWSGSDILTSFVWMVLRNFIWIVLKGLLGRFYNYFFQNVPTSQLKSFREEWVKRNSFAFSPIKLKHSSEYVINFISLASSVILGLSRWLLMSWRIFFWNILKISIVQQTQINLHLSKAPYNYVEEVSMSFILSHALRVEEGSG